jgi:hypothetical protein
MFPSDAMPACASTWQLAIDALGRDAAEVLRRRRPAVHQ